MSAVPLVSVIIPTYNRAWILPEAVESVLAQTFRDFEILIVDDGSTDDTARVVRERYGNNTKVRYFHKENGGPAAARNLGSVKARGKWLAFHDSDDLWLPEKLLLQMRKLEEHPEAALCFSDAVFQGGEFNGKRFFEVSQFPGAATLSAILRQTYIPAASVVMRKNVWDQTGRFDEHLPAASDWDMWIRVLAQYPVIYVNRPLYIYRFHEHSQIVNNTTRMQAAMLTVAEKNMKLMVRAGVCAEEIYAGFYPYFHTLIFRKTLQDVLALEIGNARKFSATNPCISSLLRRVLTGQVPLDKKEIFEHDLADVLCRLFPRDFMFPALPPQRDNFSGIARAMCRGQKGHGFQNTHRQVSENFYRELMLRGRFSEARLYLGALWRERPWRLKILARWLGSFARLKLWLPPSPYGELAPHENKKQIIDAEHARKNKANPIKKTASVSVVIPTFNRAMLVSEAVDSVLAQTFRDFEIIIVDDGSTDNTREVVEARYGNNPKVRYIYKPNGGPASAQNEGIRHAEGEFVALLGDDDLWLPQKLELQIRKMDENPEAALCFSDAVFQGGKHSGKRFFEMAKFNGEVTLIALLHGTYIPAASVVIRKSCLSRTGMFDEGLAVAEDWDLWIRILERYPAVYVDEVLYLYRQHGSPQLTDDPHRVTRWVLHALEKNKNLFLEANPETTRKYLRTLASLYHHHAYLALLDGERRNSGWYLMQSVRYGPWYWKNYIFLAALALPTRVVRGISRMRHGPESP